MTNIVSGFLLTDRMLKMFKKAGAPQVINMDNFIQPIYLVSAGAVYPLAGCGWPSQHCPARSCSPASSPWWPRSRHVVVAGHPGYTWIGAALVIGFISLPLAMVPLTAVPQRTARVARLRRFWPPALSAPPNIICGSMWMRTKAMPRPSTPPLGGRSHLGFLTFTGSLMAAGKLMGIHSHAAHHLQRSKSINLSLLAVAILAGVWLVCDPTQWWLFPIIILLRGVWRDADCSDRRADMPTVIALLNAYAGLSAVAMGFVLNNKLLIAAGALDGSSGLILSIIMCKGDEPLVRQRVVRAFGQVQASAVTAEHGNVQERQRPKTQRRL